MALRVALAVRESPDWAALARDRAAGLPIAPGRYARPRGIPSFPQDIVALIARWDALARVPFFACRETLAAIAGANLRRVRGAEVIAYQDADAWCAAAGDGPFILFFCDDDDWFAPDLVLRLERLDLAGVDAVVFPLARIAEEVFTIALPPGLQVADPIGPVYRFVLRYHTNNYGLTRRALGKVRAADMVEHRQASFMAERARLVDRYVPSIVSATNKTPCSASLLRKVLESEAAFTAYLAAYLARVRRLTLPASQEWVAGPMAETVRLFERAAAG